MSPIDRARAAWHAGPIPPENSFDDVLHWHLYTPGAVIVSLPSAFLLARPVIADAPDIEHLTFRSPLQSPPVADCWHIASASGDLAALLMLARMHPLKWVSFCRHGEAKVRLYTLATIVRHGFPESTENPSPAAATSTG
jgi:hypothetical protein